MVEACSSTSDWVFEKQLQAERTTPRGSRPVAWRPNRRPGWALMFWAPSTGLRKEPWLWQINPDAIPVPACVYAWPAAAVVPWQTPLPGGLLLLDEWFERDLRSQTGMLRSLLHQLPSSNMELIPSTLPVPWQNLRVMATKERIRLALDWSATELLSAFQRPVDAAASSTINMCLFSLTGIV